MSEELGKLVEALAKAKESIQTPKKTKTAEVPTKTGGKYSYTYADRADVIESYKKPLADNGLILSHAVDVIGESLNMVLLSRLVHVGGGELTSRIPIPQTKDAQALGSWLTYLERYASCALLDLAAEDDDDGARARARKPRKEEPPRQQPRPPAPAPTVAASYACVTEEQAETIRAAAKKAGIKNKEDYASALVRFSGVNDTRRIPADKYDHVLEQIGLLNAPDPFAEPGSGAHLG